VGRELRRVGREDVHQIDGRLSQRFQAPHQDYGTLLSA
jgi:hypothetical protein